MKSNQQVGNDHTPNFITFPLAEEFEREGNSQQSIPSEEGVSQVKDWVDSKEM